MLHQMGIIGRFGVLFISGSLIKKGGSNVLFSLPGAKSNL